MPDDGRWRMEEQAYRNRVSWMMFLLSILVIWVHSYNVELFAGGLWGPSWEFAAWLEDFLSVTVGQIAVPGFFLLSSCLFFRNFTWEKLASKWKRRFFSVAVPYGVWNLLYYFGYVTATRLPFVQTVVGKEPVSFGFPEILNALLNYAYAPIFWYLFQLILLIFLSPAIYLLMKRKGVGFLCLAGMAAAIHFHLDTSHPNTDALFYYSFAAYMTLHHKEAVEGTGRKSGTPAKKRPPAKNKNGMVSETERILTAEGMKRLAARAIGMLAAVFCLWKALDPAADVLWTVAGRLLAPSALWCLLSGIRLPDARPWMRQSMFLYGIHFIIVRFINKGTALAAARLLPAAWLPEAAALVYLLLPAMAVAVSYGAALILNRWFPVVWRLLSGGRSLEG